jgi:hypothetical protein
VKWILSVGIVGMVVVAVVDLHSQNSRTSKPSDVPSSALSVAGHLEESQVPFVGCKSDGQSGPVAAPKGGTKAVMLDSTTAQELAYYEAKGGLSILAPRGWHCFGTYGSDGQSLYVSPQPIDFASLTSDSGGFIGPAVELTRWSGDTSGRYQVAQTIARVFPAHRDFVDQVIQIGEEPASSFPFGPYRGDVLTYRSNEVVEYQTPPQTDGLGTDSRLQKNDSPINGLVVLTGPDTDLVHLSVRLADTQMGLAGTIVRQTESEFPAQKPSTTRGHRTNQEVADKSMEYSSYTNPRFGFSIAYPSLFTVERTPENGDGIEYKSKDGSTSLTAYGGNTTPGSSTKSMYESALHDIAVRPTYSRVATSWFVLSWEQEGKIYYKKVFVGPGSYDGFIFSYPVGQKDEYEDVTNAISKSFHPGDVSHSL